ncbi:hypothetical protein FB451DRAFT_1181833 [Mycena latifolia]|nr:hypothetical protein FB451DRAFT_1181833 [Mycena latifolia]
MISGETSMTLPIPTGQIIHISIADIDTDTGIWGADAAEFRQCFNLKSRGSVGRTFSDRPERWEEIPEAVHGLLGVWADPLTFLAGPHNCIGFRFSGILEERSVASSDEISRIFKISIWPTKPRSQVLLQLK